MNDLNDLNATEGEPSVSNSIPWQPLQCEQRWQPGCGAITERSTGG